LSDAPPFTNTGIDFAGPLYTKGDDANGEKKQEKSYVCLFTCTSTRAVHLELVKTVESFRRFSSRQGLPARLMSDNAKTFKSAAQEILDSHFWVSFVKCLCVEVFRHKFFKNNVPLTFQLVWLSFQKGLDV